MPKQPALKKQMNNGYEYWGTMIGGKRVRFGRVDEVPYARAYSEFLKALTPKSQVAHVERKPAAGAELSVEELCQAHCAWHKSEMEESTTSNRIGFLDRWCCHRYLGRTVGSLQAATIRREHLASFMDENFKVDGWTSWNYCVAIKAAFNWAFREGHIKENHLSKYPNPPQPKADVSEVTLMTAQEVKWFFEKGEAYGVEDILRVMYATGARPGELCSVLVSDFIVRGRQLRLLNWKNGRKTQQARHIPLSLIAMEIISRRCRDRDPAASVFTGPNGAPWTPNRLQKIFRKIRDGEWRSKTDGGKFEQLSEKDSKARAKKTAQRDALSLYDFRHLWISDALQQSVPIATVAKMAGTSVKMIEKTYGHFRASDLSDVASMIEGNRQAL